MLSAVVLCGGKSRRMGRDKALIELEGKPLYLSIAERMAGIADPVFIAPGTPGRLGQIPWREVPDVAPDAGPLAGIAAGLRETPHPLVAAVAADMPHADPAVFSLLLRLHDGEDAIVPVTEEGSQPLHALYSKDALPTIEDALRDGRYRLRDVLNELEVREVAEAEWRAADPTGRFALNLNRPADLHSDALQFPLPS